MNASQFPRQFAAIQQRINPRKAFVTGTASLSYGELFERIGRATQLFRDQGLQVGDRAVVCTRDETETIVLYLAMLRCGLTAVFIDPHGSLSETILLLDAAKPRAIFMDAAMLGDVESASTDKDILLFPIRAPQEKHGRNRFGLLLKKKKVEEADDSFQGLAAGMPVEAVELGTIPEDTTALILFTSGTTSRPKGVELTYRNLYAQFQTFERQYRIDEHSHVLNHLPMHHTDGLNQGAAICLYAGCTLVRPPPVSMHSLPEILDLVYREDVSHLVTVPTVLALILRLPEELDDAFDHPSFQFVMSTAGYLEEKLWRAFEARFRVMVVNSYGLTETVSEALYCGPDDATRRLGTIGRPVDCEARVVNDAQQDVADGEMGELALRGDNIMKGYFNNPEATAEVMREGWFLTGDLASRDADGFYSIVGRKKNVIIRGGVNVYPEDVTDCIVKMSGTLDAVTFGMPDELLGEKVVSCVTLDGSGPVTVQGIVDHCRAHLASEKIPNDVYIVDDLPRGPAGKVVLKEIRAIVEKLENTALADLGDSTESRVIGIAASVFKVERGHLSRDSTDKDTQGWDSLSHLEFILKLEENFGVKLGPRDIMNISRLGNAVDIIESKASA